MGVDQATEAFLSARAERAGPSIDQVPLEQARSAGALTIPLIGPGPSMRAVQDVSLPTSDGAALTVRVLSPHSVARAALVYFHAGGWTVGDIDQADTLGRVLAHRTGCVVALVDYRRAPEHPYPTAVEDSWQALRWADAHLRDAAGDSVPLVVIGESAGGNLAAVLARRTRERGGPAIAMQILICPVTDADFGSTSYLEPQSQLALGRETMAWFWDHYAEPGRRHEPDASPLRANDLSGLAPALILLARYDVLRTEGERYAAALGAAGVPVELITYEDQMHGFFGLVNILPGSAAAIDLIADRVGHRLSELASHG